MASAVDDAVAAWLGADKNEATRAEIKALVQQDDATELARRMSPRIAFGTAGLRARMGAGWACINELIVVQTTHGLLEHLDRTDPALRTRGVVVGHDHRHHSLAYARLATGVFAAAGVPVHVYRSGPVATPLVPFAVRQVGAAAGVMITASHNPKDDNGYKLYGANGAQIVSPVDAQVEACIHASVDADAAARRATGTGTHTWDLAAYDTSPLVRDLASPAYGMIDRYIALMHEHLVFTSPPPGPGTLPTVVYTAMHGVGAPFVVRAFSAYGLPAPVLVEAQCTPDPDFPTVRYPNPEEGKGALQLAMDTADAQGATVILANDPDADRLAAAERQPAESGGNGGAWRLLSGNELGVLLAWFLHRQWQASSPPARAKAAFLASAVSSRMLARMAAALDPPAYFEETLTGFKWLANHALRLEAAGYHVLLAYEEAIGYMANPLVKDKDGISAAVVLAHLVRDVYSSGATLASTLDRLHAQFGYHVSRNHYFVCPSAATVAAIFDAIRHAAAPAIAAPAHNGLRYPAQCGAYAVRSVRDVTLGLDTAEPDGVARLPRDPASQMITVTFANGAVFTLRASGTEPKLKYYSELAGTLADCARVDAELAAVVDAAIATLVQPSAHGLVK